MMSRPKRRALLFLALTVMLLCGCSYSTEINNLFIVTGMGLDAADTPEKLTLTLQIGQTSRESSGSGEGDSGKASIILLTTTANSVLEALAEFNRNSSHNMLLNQNQVLAMGREFAEQGVSPHFDLFMRDQRARLEIPVVVVDGRGEEVLGVELDQEKTSGLFLSSVLKDQANISPHFAVRRLDFISRVLDGTSAPLVPMVRVVEKGEEEKKEIQIEGMAVFRRDQMIGRLNNDEVVGYVWTMGDVRQHDLTAFSNLGKVMFNIISLDTKQKVSLREDGGVRVDLVTNAVLGINEISGFAEMTLEELLPQITTLAQESIAEKINNTFEAARGLNADIYRFGVAVYRKYPKQWTDMEERWSELFSDIELGVEVRVKIKAVGQIGQSLEMEGTLP